MNILNSATKIVLILFALTLSALSFYIVFINSANDQVINGIISLLNNSVISVIAFYFGQKSKINYTEEDDDL